MVRKVLIVDDDLEMLHSLASGLEPYGETFSLVTAGDGEAAVEILKRDPVSLVVTDLRMPQMDGFGLLAHVMMSCPDVPVIVMTGYSTPQMETLSMGGGAIGYIEKPFSAQALARSILTALRKEADGGTLHNVSSAMFLQLVEMEQKTCTIRLTDRDSGKMGILFFQEGELVDARINGVRGEEAAYEVFSWDQVSLSIENECRQMEKRIQGDLQAILMEAMRLKDEAGQSQGETPRGERGPETGDTPDGGEPGPPDIEGVIRSKLEGALGERCGVGEIIKTDEWNGVMAQMARIGKFFGIGVLRLGLVEREEGCDLILLPGDRSTVVTLGPRCPRERIIEVLTR